MAASVSLGRIFFSRMFISCQLSFSHNFRRRLLMADHGNICCTSGYSRIAATLFFFERRRSGLLPVNWSCRFYSIGPIGTDVLSCWKCSRDVARVALFCDACDAIQSVEKHSDYFALFGLPQRFDLNVGQLTKAFRQLQSRLHPDRFAAKSEHEQQLSSDCSSLLNVAYQTLHSPYERGLHMLRLHGRDMEDEASKSFSPPSDIELLAEVMETNEALADDNLTEEELRRIDRANRITMAAITPQLTVALQCNDLLGAEALLARLKYFANIEAKIKMLELKFNAIH